MQEILICLEEAKQKLLEAEMVSTMFADQPVYTHQGDEFDDSAEANEEVPEETDNSSVVTPDYTQEIEDVVDTGDLGSAEDLPVEGDIVEDHVFQEESTEEVHSPLKSPRDMEKLPENTSLETGDITSFGSDHSSGEEEPFHIHRKRLRKRKFMIHSPESPSEEYLADLELKKSNTQALLLDESSSSGDSAKDDMLEEEVNTDSEGDSDEELPELEEPGTFLYNFDTD